MLAVLFNEDIALFLIIWDIYLTSIRLEDVSASRGLYLSLTLLLLWNVHHILNLLVAHRLVLGLIPWQLLMQGLRREGLDIVALLSIVI